MIPYRAQVTAVMVTDFSNNVEKRAWQLAQHAYLFIWLAAWMILLLLSIIRRQHYKQKAHVHIDKSDGTIY